MSVYNQAQRYLVCSLVHESPVSVYIIRPVVSHFTVLLAPYFNPTLSDLPLGKLPPSNLPTHPVPIASSTSRSHAPFFFSTSDRWKIHKLLTLLLSSFSVWKVVLIWNKEIHSQLGKWPRRWIYFEGLPSSRQIFLRLPFFPFPGIKAVFQVQGAEKKFHLFFTDEDGRILVFW